MTKYIIIILLSILPFTLSAQLLRSYGVVEIGSTFPTSTSTGAKFAYRTTDSSFYRWISGNTWVKIVEPSIDPDTLYLKQLSGTTALVDGDTIDISTYLLKSDTASMLTPYIRLAGYGLSKLTTHTLQVDTSVISTKTYTNRFLLKSDTASMLLNYPSTVGYGIIDGGKTWRADTTSPNGLATRLFAKTLPTTIGAGQVAYSNGTNLIGSSIFTWDNTNGKLFLNTTSTSDALGLTGASYSNLLLVNGTSKFSFSGNSNQPYFAVTNGAIQVFGAHANPTDGAVFGSYSNHKVTFRAGGNTNRLEIATDGTLSQLNTTSGFKVAVGTDAQRPTNSAGIIRWSGTGLGIEVANGSNWSYLLRSSLSGGVGLNTYVPYFGSDGYITASARLTYASDYLFTVKGTSYPTIQIQNDAGTIYGKLESAGPYGLFSLYATGGTSGLSLSGQANSSNNYLHGAFQLGAITGRTSFLDVTPSQAGGDISGAGHFFRIRTSTFQNNVSPTSTTIASGSFSSFDGGTVSATNTGIVYTDFSTLRIAAAPTAGTNVTLSNPWSFQVVSGNTNLGTGYLYLPGQEIRFGPLSSIGNLNIRQYWGGGVNSSIQMGAANTVNTSYVNGGIFLGSRNNHYDGLALVVGNQNTIASPSAAIIFGAHNVVNTMSGNHITVGSNNTNTAYTNGQVASIIIGDFNNTNGFYGGGLFGTNLKYYANKQLAFGGNSNSANFAINDVYFGYGVRNEFNSVNSNNGHGPNISINPSQAYAGTDQNGGNLNLNGGIGTSAGTPGDVNIATATALSTGTVYQTLTNRVIVKGTSGFVGIGGTPSYFLDLNSTNAIRLARGTDAERPTNAFGLLRGNTTGNGIEFGNGSNWSYLLRSSLTGGIGTATYIPFFDANGQVTQSPNILFNNNVLQLTNNGVSVNYLTLVNSSYPGTGLKIGGILNTPYNSQFEGLATTGNLGGFLFDRTTPGIIAIHGGAGSSSIRFYGNTGSTGYKQMEIQGNLLSGTNSIAHTTVYGIHTVASASGGEIRTFAIRPTHNHTGPGAKNATGLYYEATLTSMVNTTHRAIETYNGDLYFGSNSGVMGIRTAPDAAYELKLNGDLYVQDSTRLTTTPAHSSITGVLTRNADGWVGLGTSGEGISYSGGVLKGGIYAGNGTINGLRSIALGTNSYFDLKGATNNDYINWYLASSNNRAQVNANSYISGSGSANAASTIFESQLSGGSTKTSDITTEAIRLGATTGTQVYARINAEMSNGREYARSLVSLDSIGNVVIAGHLMKSDSSTTNSIGKQHFAGLVENGYTSGLERIYVDNASFTVQTTSYNNSSRFDWLRIEGLDSDTTSNNISLYNRKYYLPNARPDAVKAQVIGINNSNPTWLYPVRDTFIQDVSLFSVGTLLNTCNELHITSSMTSTASANQEIRFPDAANYLRGKKIIVYSARKDAGLFVPVITVNGGVSRLRYTTDPSISGSMPTDNASLNIDGSTWSYNGTTFEWTCVKIDNTPAYRWVLNQR